MQEILVISSEKFMSLKATFMIFYMLSLNFLNAPLTEYCKLLNSNDQVGFKNWCLKTLNKHTHVLVSQVVSSSPDQDGGEAQIKLILISCMYTYTLHYGQLYVNLRVIAMPVLIYMYISIHCVSFFPLKLSFNCVPPVSQTTVQ